MSTTSSSSAKGFESPKRDIAVIICPTCQGRTKLGLSSPFCSQDCKTLYYRFKDTQSIGNFGDIDEKGRINGSEISGLVTPEERQDISIHPDSRGVIYGPYQDRYEGELHFSLPETPHGQGELFYSNGDIFRGYWSEGRRTYGELTQCGGLIVTEGKIENSMFVHGKETRSYPYALGNAFDGSHRKTVYEGEFKSYKRHGHGKFKDSEGYIFEGRFRHGNIDGTGVLGTVEGTTIGVFFYQLNAFDVDRNIPSIAKNSSKSSSRVHSSSDGDRHADRGKSKFSTPSRVLSLPPSPTTIVNSLSGDETDRPLNEILRRLPSLREVIRCNELSPCPIWDVS